MSDDLGKLDGEAKTGRGPSIPTGDSGVLRDAIKRTVYFNRVELAAVKLQKAAGWSAARKERSDPILKREALGADEQVDHFID